MDTLSLPSQGLVGAAIYHSPSEEEGISQKVHKYGGDRYKDAGVDIDAGNAFVEAIKLLAEATKRPGVASNLGGFGALFDLKEAGYQDPMLVAATDGVGTKVLVAEAAGHHDAIGVDLVAMCVNDLVVQGAEPLFFLDYLATGKLDVEAGRDLTDNFYAIFTDKTANWQDLSIFYYEVFWPYLVGGIVPGIVTALICYYVSVPVIRVYQKRRRGAIMAKLAVLKKKKKQADGGASSD